MVDCVWPPQATRWPGGRSKRTRQWRGCGNSIPRYVFPLSKTCWALLGAPKTFCDTKKDCGKPGCPNDHRSQVLVREDEVIEKSATSAHGHFSDLARRPT